MLFERAHYLKSQLGIFAGFIKGTGGLNLVKVLILSGGCGLTSAGTCEQKRHRHHEARQEHTDLAADVTG